MSYIISVACSVYRKVGHPVVCLRKVLDTSDCQHRYLMKDRSVTSTTATCDAETYCCTVLYSTVF